MPKFAARLLVLVLYILMAPAGKGQTSEGSEVASSNAASKTTSVLAAPTQMPAIVRDAAKDAAKIIIDRRDRKDRLHRDDPEGVFVDSYLRIAIFAVAAAAGQDAVQSLSSQRKYIAAAESARTDKQSGSSDSGLASTNPVDKPGLPELLNVAIEHGAVEK